MLNAVLIIADPQLAAMLRGMAGESSEFVIESVVQIDGTGYSLARALDTITPDVILLEMTDFSRDAALASAIHKRSPEVPLVGLATRDVELALGGKPNADLGSLAVWPFTIRELERAISAAVHQQHGGIFENLIAFLPGKAGSGASTVALNSARTLSLEMKRRVLVIEGDLHSGLLSAMLQAEPKLSTRDALANARHMDAMGWQQYVTSGGGVDFLLTNTAVKQPMPSWADYFQLLRFTITKYDFVLVDLPEIVNSATAEVVRCARAVFVVSTPEMASLKLTKQRCQELNRWEVDRGRIQVLLNRGHKNDIGAKDAEKFLECRVAETFPNDYKSVQRAIADASSIEKRSELGAAYLAFSQMLTGKQPEKKSFLGRFLG